MGLDRVRAARAAGTRAKLTRARSTAASKLKAVDGNRLKPCSGRPSGLYGVLESEGKTEIPAKTEGLKSPAWGVLAVFAAVAVPGVFIRGRFADQWDEATYHYPTILKFASTLPHPDLTRYQSGTGPLFHLIMAMLVRAGFGLLSLRLINLGLSATTLILVMLYLKRHAACASGASVCIVTLVFALCPYLLGPSIRLATDNLALGCAVAILYLLDDTRPASAGVFLLAVVLAVIAVLTRQLYLWLVPLLLAYAACNAAWNGIRKAIAIAASLTPCLAIAPLFIAWHGLIPPDFAERTSLNNRLFNEKALILVVCISGLYALVFAPQLTMVLRPLNRRARLMLLGVVGLSLICLPILKAKAGDYIVPTEGGWLRALAERTPAFLGVWSLFWVLFPIGWVVICAIGYHVLQTRTGYWLLAGFALWLAFNLLQGRAMAKYYEPFEIIVLGRFAVEASPSNPWSTAPALCMAAAFVVIDIARFWLSAPWAVPGLSQLAPG